MENRSSNSSEWTIDNFLELWYEALHHPVGIAVESTGETSIHALTVQMNKARAAAGDQDLYKLSIYRSPTSENQLWLMHKESTIAPKS
jgi:hypothetical protein